MIEKGWQSKKKNENSEFGFEEGIKQIMGKINLLLRERDVVVVSVAGPSGNDTSVGKTMLAGRIVQECLMSKIPSIMISKIDSYTKVLLEWKDLKKGVVVLEAMGSPGDLPKDKVEFFRSGQDNSIQLAANRIGIPLSKIDLRIFIYGLDRKIYEADKIISDVVIRNEFAEDKRSG